MKDSGTFALDASPRPASFSVVTVAQREREGAPRRRRTEFDEEGDEMFWWPNLLQLLLGFGLPDLAQGYFRNSLTCYLFFLVT